MNIENLRALLQAATPGPWRALLASRGLTGVHATDCKIYHAPFEAECLKETHDRQKSDAALIVEMRNALPALLDRLEKLEALEEMNQIYLNTLEHYEGRLKKLKAVAVQARIVERNCVPCPEAEDLLDMLNELEKV